MKIGLIDLNTGNMGSLISAMSKLNVKIKICNSKNDLSEVNKIILPGVGAFKDFMKKIKIKGLDQEIKKLSQQNTKILGVCLGFQILFEKSTEHGITKGLSLVEGKIDSLQTINKKLKVPHVGWNSCKYSNKNILFDGIENNSDFYFTHSYFLKDHNKKIYGVQFHPEKSQINGLRLLRNFCELI